MTAPVVFVHGFLGFDYIPLGFRRVYYFRGLRPLLEAAGIDACFPRLPPRGSVAERAAVLARQLERISGDTLHLVGHSMGGLDSRYLAAHLDADRRVASVTTIGTPHRGSPVARWMLDTNGPLQRIGQRWWRTALEELTPERCSGFNDRVPDRPDVRYRSWAGVRPVDEMLPWFRPWARMIATAEGDNDSQVSVSSAQWGDFRGTVPADHLELVGWNLGLPSKSSRRPFDHRAFFQRLLTDLR